MDLFEELMRKKETVRYFDADAETLALVEELVRNHEALISARDAKIKFLFYKSEREPNWLGRCSKASKKWMYIAGVDYVIEINYAWWREASDLQKRALLFHELRHVMRVETKKGIRWVVREHEITGFLDEVRIFGPWSERWVEVKKLLGGADEAEVSESGNGEEFELQLQLSEAASGDERRS
ncbi:MAG: putative metallopeptidase [Candidatus Methanomethylicaceae archaeon]